ncbi:MAG: UvrD-helicase domain-containing protein [Bacteroidales bacterium]|nr:UvrD-helicase domain-containing protein [Bacteroidales bacterium]
MKNTTFVSAGAGSGKTYRLTQDIAQMITEGKCQAEEIILTTFTEAAAKELREKVRSTLYSKGLYDAAMNIDNAAIGTIHSIAYQFVSRYWYLLGISANVSIMDTEGSRLCVSQSLASLPTEEDLKLFDTMCRSFNLTIPQTSHLDLGFWKRELKNIIDKTVELCIDEQKLEQAKEESKKLLNEVIRWSNFNISNDIISEVISRLNPIFDTIASNAKKDKEEKRKELEDSISELKKYDGKIDGFPFAKLISIAQSYSSYNSKLAKYIQKDFSDSILYFTELVDKLPHSVQVRNLVENYIDAIFRLAIQWKKEYEDFKRKRCLLDFGDLLQKFHELLQKEEVVEDIQSRYKVAFVDEFQDCSPLQVKSFVRLSELMEHSVWVGDIKQAIYGFRGTNTELIRSIIDEVQLGKDGNNLDRLEYCWRSNKTILDLVNNIFCEKVFCGQLPDELIRLGMPNRTENDPPALQERDLQHMHFVCGRKEDVPEALAEKVEELITSGTFKPNEIAILYRYNSDVAKCTKALKERGIIYNARFDSETNEVESSTDDISSFINAVVSFAARGDNELSKAIIANRIEPGCSTSKLLINRLQYLDADDDKKNWLSDLNIIGRISDIRKTIGNQSVSAAVETIVVELNLTDLIKRIDPTAPAYNYCSALESKAATYEGMSANFGLSSTLVGFVEYLKEHPIEYPGDDNGVSVMTYHKSKGLEWPCVILCSLHKVPVEAKKTFFGVLTYNTENDTLLCLVPNAIKGFTSSMMERFEENDFFREIRRATINEAKRLMYVGMTRPKEQLILTTYGPRNGDDWLTSIGCDSIDSHSPASVVNWGKANWNHILENYVISEIPGKTANAEEIHVLKHPTERSLFDVKFVSSSKAKVAKQSYVVEQSAIFAKRISLNSDDGRDNTVGDFIHHVMCLWNGDKSVIKTLAKAYGVSVDIDAVAISITNFWNWMENTYGKATQIERELPFSFVNENGQVVNGEIDLVYRTTEGDVLVDYKTYQGSVAHLTDESSDFHTGKKYGGQISLYEEALKRNNSVIRDRLVCYLSLGVIIKIKL